MNKTIEKKLLARELVLAIRDKKENEVCKLLIFISLLAGRDNEFKKELLMETDEHGWNVLMFAAFAGKAEICNVLLAGVDNEFKKELLMVCDKSGMSALMLASRRGKAEVCQVLLEGIDNESKKELLMVCDKSGVNSLMYAARRDQRETEICELILEAVFDYDEF